MIPIRTLLRSLAHESRMKIIQTRAQACMKATPTETRLGMTTADTVFAITSQAKHDFQLNKAMNMRCRSPEQHKRKGTTNSHTGNSTSMSFCTTSSPSLSSVCPVLWVILPHPARGSLSCGSMCCGLSLPLPPVCQGERPGLRGGVTRMTYDFLLGREAWLWGGGIPWGAGWGPATRRRGTIYGLPMCTAHVHLTNSPSRAAWHKGQLPEVVNRSGFESFQSSRRSRHRSWLPLCQLPLSLLQIHGALTRF